MKIAIFFGITCALISTALHSEPVFQVTSDWALICETDAQLHIASLSSDAGDSPACCRVSKGYTFEAMNRKTFYLWPEDRTKSDAMVYGRELATDSGGQVPAYFHIMRSSVEPVLDSAGHMVEPACGQPFGGEVARWVLAKDGTLKLKRFMVTVKCVDGQMRSTTKPLN